MRANVYNGKREVLIEWLDARPTDGWLPGGAGTSAYKVVDYRGQPDPQNLLDQVQNTYANLQRSDRGRVRRDGKATQTFYSYTLPSDWSIVP